MKNIRKDLQFNTRSYDDNREFTFLKQHIHDKCRGISIVDSTPFESM